MLSPYGRIDFSVDKLKQASETGVGAFSLTYFDQTSRSLRTSLGLRLEASHETDFGLATPRLRLEYQHGFEGGAGAQISYTDQINGTRYSSAASSNDRSAVVVGLGSDFVFRNGLTLGVDYQLLRSFSAETSHGIRFRLKKELDGKGSSGTGFVLPSIDSSMRPLGIRVNAGYTYDDNISRGRDAADKRSDQSYTVDVSKGWWFPLTENSRALLAVSGGGEKFLTYFGLNRLFGTLIAELQYRPSGDFSAPTFAVFSRLTGEQFQSDLRDGSRLAVGVSVRQSLTDRISVFGALTHTEKTARSMVFVGRDDSARVNIDYHVELDGHYYSVPHRLARTEVELRVTTSTVEAFAGQQRVAVHAYSARRGAHTTVAEHMPASHRAHRDWTPQSLIAWGERVGLACATVVRWQMEHRPHPEQGYRACLGLRSLARRYGNDRLEAACVRALAIRSPTYRSIASILATGMDRQPATASASAGAMPEHENVRGPKYLH
jgi:hypothetical protein